MARTSKRRTSRKMRRNGSVSTPLATMSDSDSHLVARRRRDLLGYAANVLRWLNVSEGRENKEWALEDWVFAYGNLMKFDCMLGFAGELDLSDDELRILMRDRDALFDSLVATSWKRFGAGVVIPWPERSR